MSEIERRTIEIPEIVRVEGHSAVVVDIKDEKVVDVKLDVFEGTRFFERIVIGHHYKEIPHITSRVCAICSTGHVVAAALAVEHILGFQASERTELFRELMHLGMIIESHATHICALALPDFLKTPDLIDFATSHPVEFGIWTKLRALGASIQTVVGGRPFHPVNLQVGGLSHYPTEGELRPLLAALDEGRELAEALCRRLLEFKLPIERTAEPLYLALVPAGARYGYFGRTIRSDDGFAAPIDEYRTYLSESVTGYSHAKRSLFQDKPVMVGSMARLHLYGERLGKHALPIFEESPLARGKANTLYNNLAQAIEIVEAIDRSSEIVAELIYRTFVDEEPVLEEGVAGAGVGAVECPRGTLYHYYEIDEEGKITGADMITPSAQNTARIEQDIKAVVENDIKLDKALLQSNLETLVRAYDPCNTCATHMVEIRYAD